MTEHHLFPDAAKPKIGGPDVLNALGEAMMAFPEQRVGQIIVNALGTDPYYMTNEEAVKEIRTYIETMNRLRRENVPRG